MKNKFRLSSLVIVLMISQGAIAHEFPTEINGVFENKLEIINQMSKLDGNYSRNISNKKGISAVQEREWSGAITSVPVATVLMEFPDALHNTIKPDKDGHYYEDYSQEHFNKLVYSENGLVGPRNKRLMSARQYLRDQSGNSFDIYGESFGWYLSKESYKFYGGGDEKNDIRDINPRQLVREAVANLLADPNFKLEDYDSDQDGYIDHLSIIHSTLGGEAFYDRYSDFIWSHRGEFSEVVTNEITGKSAGIKSYVIQPIDAAAGVLAHEFGHDLGLPDEYDHEYSEDHISNPGSTVGRWSMMASGSHTGVISGTEPVGYSPFAKLFLQNKYGGNWVQSTEIDSSSLDSNGVTVKLHQASSKGQYNDLVKVNLPSQTAQLFTPLNEQSIKINTDGIIYYAHEIDFTEFSNPRISLDINMTDKTTPGWGFVLWAYNTVTGNMIQVSPEKNKKIRVDNKKIIGVESGWQRAEYDLSILKNEESVILFFNNFAISYPRDFVAIDNIEFVDEGKVITRLDSNSDDLVVLRNVEKSNGSISYSPYYLLEWRQHTGVDKALANASYEEGMLVWYVDPSYMHESLNHDNRSGAHPGEGWLKVIDSDRNPMIVTASKYDNNGRWLEDSYNVPLSSLYQVKDAPFNSVTQLGSRYEEVVNHEDGTYTVKRANDYFVNGNPRFVDWDDYSNHIRPATGSNIPAIGLVFEVINQTKDKSVAEVNLSKLW
ncbi:hypothetical protein CS022_05265 [Veronia nyctiphanis]|uniref:Uncharacterized protein n=1 Tax=Veronia nyctiphanis TaxID=1278244 RepID=A0A4Q0YS84_9GAMM|nr:immune inhibitor A domain-containing protein [Veronia nyctiphanis]RXJ74052.1 hypothetical protein CS022_05265 [Veronia nyctiphanis]